MLTFYWTCSLGIATAERSLVRPDGIPQLHGVHNFRVVSPAIDGIYRSGALDQASEFDAAWILDGARIRTIIDLRNSDEIGTGLAASTQCGRLLQAAYDQQSRVGTGCIASEGDGTLKRYHVPILCDLDALFDEVATRMSPVRKAQAALIRTVDGKGYDRFLYEELARGKQALLYTAMLRSASAELTRALELAVDRRNGATLIHCAKGKDRTGLLAALLQHAAGVAQEEIVESYAASEDLLPRKETHAGMQESGSGGAESADSLVWNALRGSPPEAMQETLDWVRGEYGAIDSYLEDQLGLTNKWRQYLRTRAPP